jgi:hypothetical protein
MSEPYTERDFFDYAARAGVTFRGDPSSLDVPVTASHALMWWKDQQFSGDGSHMFVSVQDAGRRYVLTLQQDRLACDFGLWFFLSIGFLWLSWLLLFRPSWLLGEDVVGQGGEAGCQGRPVEPLSASDGCGDVKSDSSEGEPPAAAMFVWEDDGGRCVE